MSSARAVAVAVLLGAAVVVGVTSGAVASTAASGFFKTPSGKIVCVWVTGGSPAAMVECGVEPGLKPPIPKTGADCQHLDYVGNRVSLPVSGRVQLIPCAGDAGPFGNPGQTVYLRYGATKSIGGITCTETTKGLTCRNPAGHGFFLSLRAWHVF